MISWQVHRPALMNLFLHNIGDIHSDIFISPADARITTAPTTYDYVPANPPFGKKSSQPFPNEEGEQEKEDLTYSRQDFWVTTSNKQLNFVQHIRSILKTTARPQLFCRIMYSSKATQARTCASA